MTITVRLPWPDKRLSPNARVHWLEKSRVSRNAKWDAALVSRQSGLGAVLWARADVKLTFHPPDRRRRDWDNLLASMKPSLDGIAAVVRLDDSRWRLSMDVAEPIRGGMVVVELSEGQCSESTET